MLGKVFALCKEQVSVHRGTHIEVLYTVAQDSLIR